MLFMILTAKQYKYALWLLQTLSLALLKLNLTKLKTKLKQDLKDYYNVSVSLFDFFF